MRFHRPLGNVQVASDFRVVTSLQQKFDNLPLPRSHLAESLFHKELHLTDNAPEAASGAETCPPSASGIRVFASHFAFTRPKWCLVVN